LVEASEALWGNALLAASAAEEEASKALNRVAEAAGWSQEEIRRQVAAFGERLAAQRRELERGVEEGVRKAMARLTVPRREQIDEYKARLDQLSKRLDRLLRKR
jgi:polyhydroxyalkanoate synthesis regulator phasin